MPIFTPTKTFDPQTPTDELDQTFLFNNVPVGDTVATAIVTASPPGLTLTAQTLIGNSVTVWVTGGVAGTTYTLTCTVTTAGGRTYGRSASLPIQATVPS